MVFEEYKLVVSVVVILQISLILIWWRSKPLLATNLTIMSLMLKGQFIWVGVPLYAWQVSGIMGLLFFLSPSGPLDSSLTKGHGPFLGWMRVSMVLYVILTILISLAMWSFLCLEGRISALPNVSWFRIATQLGYFLLTFGLFVFGAFLGRYVTTYSLLQSIGIFAVIVAYFAIIQTIIFIFFNVNIFPIIRPEGEMESAFILDLVFRASSFAGEPKHLGLVMALGLTSLWIMRFSRMNLGRMWLHKPVAMILATILSLSATGIYVAITTVLVLSILFNKKIRSIDMLLISTFVFLSIVFCFGIESNFGDSLMQQVTKGSVEVQDASVFLSLVNNPILVALGAGLGNIHLYAVDYLPKEFPLFRDQAYKGNTGLALILGDSGLIGIFVFLLSNFFGIGAAINFGKFSTWSSRNQSTAILALLFGSLISFLLRYNEIHFFVMGLYFSIVSGLQKSLKMKMLGR